jgi:hypothetical protein
MLVEPEPHHAGGVKAGALMGCGSGGSVNFFSSVFLSNWHPVRECCGSGRIRIRSDPDLFGRIRILGLINYSISTFLVYVKAIHTVPYFRNLCCLTCCFMRISYFLEHIFIKKKFQKKSGPKIYLGQDPDPDDFERRIRIRSKIDRIWNTAVREGTSQQCCGSGGIRTFLAGSGPHPDPDLNYHNLTFLLCVKAIKP